MRRDRTADIAALAAEGELEETGLKALPEELVRPVVVERVWRWENSIYPGKAAKELGWSQAELACAAGYTRCGLGAWWALREVLLEEAAALVEQPSAPALTRQERAERLRPRQRIGCRATQMDHARRRRVRYRVCARRDARRHRNRLAVGELYALIRTTTRQPQHIARAASVGLRSYAVSPG